VSKNTDRLCRWSLTYQQEAGVLPWPRSRAIEAGGRTRRLAGVAFGGLLDPAANEPSRPIALDLAAALPTCTTGPRVMKVASRPGLHPRHPPLRQSGSRLSRWPGSLLLVGDLAGQAAGQDAAESLSKGSRVVVVGRLQQRSWTAEDGSARSVVEVVAEELGASLRWATATTTRTTRSQEQASTASAKTS
jgi:Single-strand binding protein family